MTSSRIVRKGRHGNVNKRSRQVRRTCWTVGRETKTRMPAKVLKGCVMRRGPFANVDAFHVLQRLADAIRTASGVATTNLRYLVVAGPRSIVAFAKLGDFADRRKTAEIVSHLCCRMAVVERTAYAVAFANFSHAPDPFVSLLPCSLASALHIRSHLILL